MRPRATWEKKAFTPEHPQEAGPLPVTAAKQTVAGKK